MSETTISAPCERLIATFVEQIAPKMEALVKEFSWAGLFELFDDVVQAVENMEGIGKGPDKKACAIEIVLAVYDKYQFDIPYIPSIFERRLLKLILDMAIDGIVAILNKRGIFVHGTE
jgi:ketopantoate reductase